VEFAIVMPLLVAIILAGIYFGRVLILRHRLTDAINLATRVAGIATDPRPTFVLELVEERLGATPGCSGLSVNVETGASVLTAELHCILDIDTWLGPLDIRYDEIVVSASAPIDTGPRPSTFD